MLRTSIYDLRLWYTAHFASLVCESYCPLVPQYEVETSSVSLLSLDTMLTLLDGVGLALLLAH